MLQTKHNFDTQPTLSPFFFRIVIFLTSTRKKDVCYSHADTYEPKPTQSNSVIVRIFFAVNNCTYLRRKFLSERKLTSAIYPRYSRSTPTSRQIGEENNFKNFNTSIRGLFCSVFKTKAILLISSTDRKQPAMKFACSAHFVTRVNNFHSVRS